MSSKVICSITTGEPCDLSSGHMGYDHIRVPYGDANICDEIRCGRVPLSIAACSNYAALGQLVLLPEIWLGYHRICCSDSVSRPLSYIPHSLAHERPSKSTQWVKLDIPVNLGQGGHPGTCLLGDAKDHVPTTPRLLWQY